MGWLSAAAWELCMAMLPHRSTRALLVPVLCVALLAPLAATSGAQSRARFEPTPHALGSADGLYVPRARHLAEHHDPAVRAAPAVRVPVGSSDDGDSGGQRGQLRAADSPQPRSRGVVFLDRDGSGAVPRKFTIPEPSVVADADHKHVAVLPSKPYAAAVHKHRLLRRGMLERSGVSLARVMIVITVDGRVHGVDRYDGAILWSRRCLFESAGPDHAGRQACPRGMVQTKGRRDSSLDGGLRWGDGPSEQDLGGDGSSGDEEEWLLEQGIDWRSSPHVLERQRQLRRAWLARQQAAPRGGGGGSPGPRDYAADLDNDRPDAIYIAEPGGGGGSLYMYSSEAGLQKLPLAVADLVDQSPVQVRGVLYTGSKEASFAAVDVLTGELLDVYGDARSDSSTSARRAPKPREREPAQRLLLGEKLSRVRIYPTSDEAPGHGGEPQWELHHRSVHAPSLDPDVDAVLAELSDAVEALGARRDNANAAGDARIHGSPRGPTKFVMTHDGGFVMVEAATGIPLWAQEFDSPVVSVFDVFGIAAHGHGAGADAGPVEYVARKRDLSPAAQQNRYL
ncbi:bifunctional endoribonuclease/protein kinase ire1, partial [Coemansia nantahalensis]